MKTGAAAKGRVGLMGIEGAMGTRKVLDQVRTPKLEQMIDH